MAWTRKQIVGNAAAAELTAGINDTDLSMTIDNATNWPDGSVGPFVVAVGWNTPTEEHVLCTSRSGVTITIDADGRGHDGTTAAAHAINAPVVCIIDAETLDQANRYVNLQTTKGDLVSHDGTNARRVASGATNADTDGYVPQLSWAAAAGWVIGRLITVLHNASAPNVGQYVRLWYDTTLGILRASDGTTWHPSVAAPVVANATARDALYTRNGAVVWRSDLGFAEIRVGGAWRPLGRAVFADTTARDSYFATPADGNECYITGAHQVQLYRSDRWVVTSQVITVASSEPSGGQAGDIWLRPL